MITGLVFYVFAIVLVLCGVMVISVRNPVHSVLFLILAFFNAAALMVTQGAEFIAMLLVVVYAGAVAVLFLFVVMMLDVNVESMRRGLVRYLPIGGAVGVALLVELGVAFAAWRLEPSLFVGPVAAPTPDPDRIGNTEALGNVLYTQYMFLFHGAGLILLVAMVGAIVLTLRHRDGVRRQRIDLQNACKPSEAVRLVKVRAGEGI